MGGSALVQWRFYLIPGESLTNVNAYHTVEVGEDVEVDPITVEANNDYPEDDPMNGGGRTVAEVYVAGFDDYIELEIDETVRAEAGWDQVNPDRLTQTSTSSTGCTKIFVLDPRQSTSRDVEILGASFFVELNSVYFWKCSGETSATFKAFTPTVNPHISSV